MSETLTARLAGRTAIASKGVCSRTVMVTFLAALVAFAAGCASTAQLAEHSFAFDMRRDGQSAEVLDYRYGDSRLPVRAPQWAVKEGRSFDFNRVHGVMQRGDFLYVKWRDPSTGAIHEENADLRPRLPSDIAGHTVYFMIRSNRLFVYLIGPEGSQRPSATAAFGPSLYRDRGITRLHPDRADPSGE